jgi:hypothetical protein
MPIFKQQDGQPVIKCLLFLARIVGTTLLLGLPNLDLYSQGLEEIARSVKKVNAADGSARAAAEAELHDQCRAYFDRQLDSLDTIGKIEGALAA